MIVAFLILIAAVLLGVGVVTGNQTLAEAALGLSGVAAFLIVAFRFANRSRQSPIATDHREQRDQPAAASAQVAVRVGASVPGLENDVETSSKSEKESDLVVFIAGRTTFHSATCSMVTGKTSSRAERRELEGGGMVACRRCLTAAQS